MINDNSISVRLTLVAASTLLFSVPIASAAQEASLPQASPVAQAKYIPQRMDDIAWENDRIAYRIYGPALEKKEPTGSGIDVWGKSVRYPIIDKWYASGDYHEDHGEGLDFFGVGHSRGCGGLGIWDGTSLSCSGHWQSYEIVESGSSRAQFRIQYAPWKLPDGHEVSEQRSITLENGSNLNRLVSTLKSDLPTLTVGIGIVKLRGGELFQDKEHGILAYWQPENPDHGTIGCAVLVPPEAVVGFGQDKQNNLVFVKVKTGTAFSYQAGACWSRGLDFKSFDEWKAWLLKQAQSK